MEVNCSACGSITKISQKKPYHAGFSTRGFLYNDSRPAIMEFSPYSPKYIAIVGDKHPWALNDEEKNKIEEAIKPDPDGGQFRFSALPRCPECNAELPDLLPDNVHFVEIGDVIDGDKEEVWF
jgi:hypothetical protein